LFKFYCKKPTFFLWKKHSFFLLLFLRKSRMNLKKLKFLNTIVKKTSDLHENYFELARNYSFTNLQLKQKRILAFLLQKLIMIPEFQRLVFQILSYFLRTYDMKIEKIEEDLCEVFPLKIGFFIDFFLIVLGDFPCKSNLFFNDFPAL